ncbi:hypothetical protein CBR_g48790 [Chara braunii]|uniref:DUF659 domain-containing protein n=1 Tax=Chara braunii TaxID=69332 RepID=A0A388M3C6_CHABU|nr:hypothetical protein CBR_g48790 [Chara braunii]|eukprot:GBG89080.1 hypothetical protein CBR_g48790 [Chara braunii]
MWCEQGQEVANSKGRGEYWVRCRLCSTIWRGSASKVAEHFLKPMRPCALQTGEIVHTLVAGGAEVQPNDKNTKYLLRNYKGGEAESDVHRGDASHGEEGLEDPQTDEPQPPPVAGRPVAGIANMLADALDEGVDAGGAAEGGGGEEGQGAGIAFNFLNMDTTQTLHAVYVEVANAGPKMKLPSYNYMRTVMLDIIYLKIQEEVNPMTRCQDSTGCTFIIDGSTDRKNRPVMNFLAAGEQGVVLVTTVTMSGRKKNVVDLAKLWEQVMREIGLQRINAICTDNDEVNKKAAQILKRRKDKDVERILWVPCGAHCCSLLLKDLANLLWIKGIVKTANTIVKFIRNHYATHDLMMTVDDSLSLLRPMEVRFGSVYQMLQRLADREDVLVTMVDGRAASKWRALRWSGEKLRRRADVVYYTVRSEVWWPQVRKIVDIMHPIFQLLKRMDAEGTPPTNLVEYDDMIRRKLTNVVLTKKEREDVMENVCDRVQRMRQLVHAATFVLDPRRWNERWLFDQNSAVMQNAMRYFLRQIGGEWNNKAHSDLWAELMEFQKEPVRVATEQVCTEPGKDKCEAAFKHLKHALTHHEVLKLLDLDKPFIVTTDASQYGIGAVLAQQEGKKLRPVEYMSKKMPSQKLAKSTYEKELYVIYKALTHWRHYLLGRFFYVRIDHQTLRWMKTQPVLSDARWIEVIEQYDFERQYIKGEYTKVVDVLSRRPDFLGALVIEFGLEDNVTQSLVDAYREDPFMAEIIRRLEAKDKETSAEFELINGLLFFEKAGNKRLCVPNRESLRSLFPGECHDATGHFGFKKTATNLLQRFWWPTMMRDAKLYVETCQVCQRDKPRTQASLGLLKPLPIL